MAKDILQEQLVDELKRAVESSHLDAESLLKKLREAEKHRDELNNLLREVGWGQGEIDSAATVAEWNEDLRNVY